MEALLYSVSPIVLLLAAIVVAAILACGGQVLVHRRFAQFDFVQHNEVGGYMITVVGTLYAVVLGFLTIVAWQHYSETQDQVSQESAAAADAWHTAVGLPYDRRYRVWDDIESYANTVSSVEWSAMRTGGFSTKADIIVMDAIDAAESFKPANDGEMDAQTATMTQLTGLHDARQQRLNDNHSALSWFEWLVLFIGAACVTCFCWLFGVRNSGVHILMTAAVSTIIASTLVLLFELQYPFRSPIGIAPDTWTALLAHIKLMKSGSLPGMW